MFAAADAVGRSEPPDAEGPIIERIRRIVTHSLGLNAAQWARFVNDSVHRQRLAIWLQPQSSSSSSAAGGGDQQPQRTAHLRTLIFHVLANGTLSAGAFLPAAAQFRKATYFLKTAAARRVTADNFGHVTAALLLLSFFGGDSKFNAAARSTIIILADGPLRRHASQSVPLQRVRHATDFHPHAAAAA